ncbi:MAG: flagellar basal body-associated FliL family protein [Treponema sp.]|nr:flagellar basal body-associated FliL family protein [Treponema sp.]
MLIGTIYGIFFMDNPESGSRFIETEQGYSERQDQIFTGLGRIRVPTMDAPPGVVIIFVSFAYDSGDRAFSEELVLKIGDLRDIISGYFGAFTVNELSDRDEEIIKIELLRRFNAILRLGQIQTLYFTDYFIM